MNLLADENAPRNVVEALRLHGYDVLWIKEYCRGLADEKIIGISVSESRVILTFDKDFGELVYRLNMKNVPGVILIRMPDNRINSEKILMLLKEYGDRLEGYFTVLTMNKIRRRRMPES